MRIAIVRQRYTPFGGAERFVERALAALAQRDVEITLICREWSGGEPAPGSRRVICDPPVRKLPSRRASRDRGFAECARREFESGGYDIVQSHERIPGCQIFRAGDGVHAAWLEALARSRGALRGRALRLDPYHRYLLAAERKMLAHPNLRAVICNSTLVRDDLERHYGLSADKMVLIPNGLDLERFHPRARGGRAAVRGELGIPESAPLVLFVGGGFERKGVGRLIRAMSRTPARGARLVVVGADARRRRFEDLAGALGVSSRVCFVGPQQDVARYYGAADLLCLPTLYDPCPNAALEALACGLPVITSTNCGARDFVREGVNGALVDALDVEGLALAIGSLCEPGRAAAMSEAARAAVAGLSTSALADRLLDLYRRLLGDARMTVQ